MFGKGKRMALDAFRPIIIYTPLHLWLATNKRSFRTIIRGDKVQMPLVLGAITQMHVSLFFPFFFFSNNTVHRRHLQCAHTRPI